MTSKPPLGPALGYVEMLNTATLERSAKNAAGPNEFYPLRPSSAGKCTRELAYELAEFHGVAKYGREVFNPEQVRLFDLGHHIETHAIQQFQWNLPEYKMKYKQQVLSFFRVEAKHHPEWSRLIEGSLDTCFYSEETRGVCDFKSKKDRFSAFHRTSWEEQDEKLERMASVEKVSDTYFRVDNLRAFLNELQDAFFESNFVQLNGYANTEFLKERGIDHASIIQYNKNDSRMREVRFRPCPVVYEATRAKFQAAVDAVDAGTPEAAPRDYVLGSLKCKFCAFKATCWPGKNVDKAFYNTLPPKQWPRDTDRMGTAGAEIEALFAERSASATAVEAKEKAEEAIVKYMLDKGVDKVRLANSEVYDVKRLKDSIVLRRGKA